MKIVNKRKKNMNKTETKTVGLQEVCIKSDKVSPAIMIFKCPICKTVKSVDNNDIIEKDNIKVIICNNFKCKQTFKIKYEDNHDRIF